MQWSPLKGRKVEGGEGSTATTSNVEVNERRQYNERSISVRVEVANQRAMHAATELRLQYCVSPQTHTHARARGRFWRGHRVQVKETPEMHATTAKRFSRSLPICAQCSAVHALSTTHCRLPLDNPKGGAGPIHPSGRGQWDLPPPITLSPQQ